MSRQNNNGGTLVMTYC